MSFLQFTGVDILLLGVAEMLSQCGIVVLKLVDKHIAHIY